MIKDTDSKNISVPETQWPTFLALEGLSETPGLAGDDHAFRILIENLPVMCYAAEPDPPYAPIYTSPALETFGYSLDEWRTSTGIWLKAIHPDDRARVIAKTDAARLAGEEVDYEYRLVARDGSIYWVRDRGRFVKDANGKLVCWLGIMMDVTDRKRADQHLRESEERYRKVFEDANDIIYIHDLKGNYISLNHAAERILGYSLNEGLAMNMSQILAPDHIGLVKKKLKAKLSGKAEKTQYEVDCVAKDGRRVTLEVNSSVVFKDGKPIAVQGIARDITDRKRSDEAMREKELKFRTLAETASDAILTIDEEGSILFANAAAETIFGYAADEILGRSLTMLMPERFHIDHRAGMKRFTQTGRKNFSWKSVQLPGWHKTGYEIPLELSFAEFSQAGRRFYTSIIRDITERKLAEEALRESEQQFRELFENASDLIYTHDMKGNVTSINRATERIIGYTREEARLMNVNEVIAPECLEFAREMTSRKLAGEHQSTYELEIISKNGSRVPIELSTRLIVKDGVPVGVQGNARDITERKRAEDSLRGTVSLLTSTLESSNDGIVVVTPEREIVVHNQRFLEMWRIPPHIIEQRRGQVVLDFVKDQMKDPDQFIDDTLRLYESPLDILTDILEFKDGRVFERYSQPQHLDGEPVGRVVSFRDITERRRSEEKLRHNALHDALTNLPNRAQFMDHLRNAIDRAEDNKLARFAVLFLD